MDSRSSATGPHGLLPECTPLAVEQVDARRPGALGTVVIVAGRDSLAGDLEAFLTRDGAAGQVVRWEESAPSSIRATGEQPGPLSLIVFADPGDRLTIPDSADLGAFSFIGVVSTFRVHLGDEATAAGERAFLDAIRKTGTPARVAVFRPGLVLSPNSRLDAWARRLAPLYPLAPDRLRACFLDGDEFFAAIRDTASGRLLPEDVEPGPRAGRSRPLGKDWRTYTYLGENRSWREFLKARRTDGPISAALTAIATAISWLQVGQLLPSAIALLGKFSPAARGWSVGAIRPGSMSELLALCHAGNIDRVRVVGYNNGVNHFGHRHPGRTVVSTVRCRRLSNSGPGTLKVDSGSTVRAARDYLEARDEELYVFPNYSYVAVGTSFFVPIHGSAVDHSTLADTVTRVVYYDPERDRIVSADRSEPGFRENVYNFASKVVVLRLHLKTKAKSRYQMKRETWDRPDASRILEALRDRSAANVEMRQGHAASPTLSVSKYYTTTDADPSELMDVPRDRLGRLWDRLEENPITCYLMHALSRHVAWHTEAFLTPEEFEVFWRTHSEVPLRKIQLRYILKDGMDHSPFRDTDCVSSDMFLFRFDKPAFDAYVARHFPAFRTNPGKHSN